MELTSKRDEKDEEEGEEEEEDDGGSWITPSNIRRIQMDAGEWCPLENVTVGCVTTDFAMQVCMVYAHR